MQTDQAPTDKRVTEHREDASEMSHNSECSNNSMQVCIF